MKNFFSRHLEWILLLMIIIAGVFLRIEAQNHLRNISPDGIAYSYYALYLLNGEVMFEQRAPLFQILLMLSYKIFGASFESSVLVPQFFGGIAPILLFFLGKRLFDSKTGLISALLGALNPMLINLSCWVLRETLSLALILMTLLTGHTIASAKTRTKAKILILYILLGLLLGLLFLTRDDYIIFLPASIAYFYLYRGRKSRLDIMIKASILTITFMLILTPWLYYSYQYFGTILPSVSKAEILPSVFSAYEYNIIKVSVGLWKQMTLFSSILSLLGFAFLPLGIMVSITKRDTWIVYFFVGIHLLATSFFVGHPAILYETPNPYQWYSGDRIIFSGVMPATVLAAYGIRRFLLFLKNFGNFVSSKISLPNNNKNRRLYTFVILGIIILGSITYVPPYYLTLEDFDQKTRQPFIESAKFLNSTGSGDAVFTLHPDLLQRYYNGPIYKLPTTGGFEPILDEAKKKGIKYLIVESTCAPYSIELSELYYHSVGYYWAKIPSEFILVDAKKWSYGVYMIATPSLSFKSAIFGHLEWDGLIAPWKSTLSLMGSSITVYGDTVPISSVDLSEFNVLVFAEYKRPLEDEEIQYLKQSVQNGLIVVVSGISPPYLAGGNSNLTKISSWFGAASFSEAPSTAKWKVNFTKNATEIMTDLVLEKEYAFYHPDNDWSTPTGCLVQPLKPIVYAYRANDQRAVIFSHKFGKGIVIFNGARYGFISPDAATFKAFLSLLIKQSIEGTLPSV